MDNAPIHTAGLIREAEAELEAQGIELRYLPSDSPQLDDTERTSGLGPTILRGNDNRCPAKLPRGIGNGVGFVNGLPTCGSRSAAPLDTRSQGATRF